MKEKMELTINDDAIVVNVREGNLKGELVKLVNLDDRKRNNIIIDLSFTENITSAFITDLVEIYDRSLKDGFNMVISGTSEMVDDVFSSLGLFKLFKFSKNHK